GLDAGGTHLVVSVLEWRERTLGVGRGPRAPIRQLLVVGRAVAPVDRIDAQHSVRVASPEIDVHLVAYSHVARLYVRDVDRGWGRSVWAPGRGGRLRGSRG